MNILERKKLCKIPKIIHQTWKTNNLPDHWKSSQEAWKKYHSSWKYILWTDEMNEQFIAKEFPWFLETFLGFEHNIQRADAIRYAFLFFYGGCYSDCDMEPLNNLDDLFVNEGVYVLESANTKGIFTNAFMASTPGQQIWLEMLIEMTKPYQWFYFGKHLQVFYTTGPSAFTKIVNRYPLTVNLLPRNILNPCNICNINCISPNARMKILRGNSWHEGFDSTFYNFVLCNWKKLLFLIILTLIFYKCKKMILHK